MPLVAAALAPNSPLLLPGLTNQAKRAVAKTAAAYGTLARELAAAAPDVLFVLATATPTTELPTPYALLQAAALPYSFTEFGDLTTSGQRVLATGFTHRLKERCETSFPLPLVSPARLPYSFAVPLVALGHPTRELAVACLQLPPGMAPDDLVRLSSIIAEYLQLCPERVAVLAVGCLARHEPGNPEAAVYDRQFRAAVASGSDAVLNFDSRLRLRVEQTLWEPSTLLYAVLAERRLGVEELSYEVPLGVGYLVVRFTLT